MWLKDIGGHLNPWEDGESFLEETKAKFDLKHLKDEAAKVDEEKPATFSEKNPKLHNVSVIPPYYRQIK